jgi:GntR family transcriptional regulator, transcriptional repressor for pyruvate dehydrogenase complex
LSDSQTVTPSERPKTYKLVADQLLELIAAGRLRPGDPVPPERELVETYRVGRSSVREALRMLESQGLIEARGHGTFTVSHARNTLNQSLELLLSVAEVDLHELFEIRRILEGECAALAAARRRESDLVRMRASIAEMESSIGSEDDYIAADLEFHLTIAEATGNRVAALLMHALRDQLHRALGTVYQIPHSAELSLDQHREIVDAISARRPEEARAAMQAHIGRVEREIDTLAARNL